MHGRGNLAASQDRVRKVHSDPTTTPVTSRATAGPDLPGCRVRAYGRTPPPRAGCARAGAAPAEHLPLVPQSRWRDWPPSAIVPLSQVNGPVVLAVVRCHADRVAPLLPGNLACRRGVVTRLVADRPIRGRPGLRCCDDVGRHVSAPTARTGRIRRTKAISRRDRARVGGRPASLLLGQRRQDVERASRCRPEPHRGVHLGRRRGGRST